MANILINATNIHVGGGIQVAASFVNEIIKIESHKKKYHLAISHKVYDNIIDKDLLENYFLSVRIVDFYGLKKPIQQFIFFKSFNVVFTIFGPFYTFRKKIINVQGFAQAWIIYPSIYSEIKINLLTLIKTKIKFYLQMRFFKRSSSIIVELDHVKSGLIEYCEIPSNKIFIVRNCVSSVFFDSSIWESIKYDFKKPFLKLGFIGRNYIHKNTKIFPYIRKCLKEKYGIESKFFVTFPNDEWLNCSQEFHDSCINIGPLSTLQCPSFYKNMDGIVFPSLLESFSATPLEALYMEVPLFASKRQFNIDICGDYANYFDPHSPDDAAQVIHSYFLNRCNHSLHLANAKKFALSFSNPIDRANKYISIISSIASK